MAAPVGDEADAPSVLVVGAAGAGVAEHLTRLGVPNRLLTADDVTDQETARLARGSTVVLVALSSENHRRLPLLQASGRPLWVDLADWDGHPSELHRPFIEAGSCLFLSDVGLDDPLRTAEQLLPGKELVVITHGKRGATAFFPDTEPFFVLPHDVGPAVDATGARDGFCSGTAYGVVHGWDWPRALAAGSTVAGACVAFSGTVHPALSAEWLHAHL
jgi:sugar/nucleoside kinase (ribokinase family)